MGRRSGGASAAIEGGEAAAARVGWLGRWLRPTVSAASPADLVIVVVVVVARRLRPVQQQVLAVRLVVALPEGAVHLLDGVENRLLGDASDARSAAAATR